ncbi:speedy protein 1-A-like [Hyperolius riggenbachi]|uniref:speedy protein 1-A-like n=1 Tax=Hyperolius riggenbachi TaxID=752182 RepID=UPI0035A35109
MAFRTGGEDACPPERSRKRPAPDDTEKRPEKRWASQQQQPVEPEVWEAFCEILEDDCIQRFLSRDRCLRISDKYLLAMVLVYFVRAGLRIEEFKGHFFAALFLANQVEEDASYYRQNIYPWALGCTWEENKDKLHQCRDDLLRRMKFQARVSRKMCDQLIAEHPSYWAWKRCRLDHHGGAIREYTITILEKLLYPAGPRFVPCPFCDSFTLHVSQWRRCCPSSSQEVPGVIVLDP